MTVPPVAAGVVLGGAALHAAWNVGIRGGADRRLATAEVMLGSALIAGAGLFFVKPPAEAAWPHLALSLLLHTLYFNLVAEAYVRGGVSLIYPVMRGLAPALTAIVVTIGFGEHLGLGGWTGLCLISGGVLFLAHRSGGRHENRGLAIALLNATVIAAYTTNDGFGVQASGSPLAYALWVFLLPAAPSALILTRLRLSRLTSPGLTRPRLLRALGGGFCSVASYATALWAMTVAPIGAIAALRETSMLFALLLAWTVLGERPGWRGLLAIVLIAAGAATLRLA